MKNYIKNIAIIIGLISLYIFLMFLETLIFWLVFGEGSQASETMQDLVGLFIVIPLIIVGYIGYRIFNNNN